jgi:hypothetical protein
MRHVALLGFLTAAVGVGCIDTPPPVKPEKPLTVTADKPLVIDLTPSPEVLGRVKGSAAGDLRLTVRELSAPASADVRVRVFVNTPTATAATTKESAGFVGNINFSHDPEAQVDFHLDPAQAFERLADRKVSLDKVSVTLVLIPLRPGTPVPADVKVTLKGVTLEKAEPVEK